MESRSERGRKESKGESQKGRICLLCLPPSSHQASGCAGINAHSFSACHSTIIDWQKCRFGCHLARTTATVCILSVDCGVFSCHLDSKSVATSTTWCCELEVESPGAVIAHICSRKGSGNSFRPVSLLFF